MELQKCTMAKLWNTLVDNKKEKQIFVALLNYRSAWWQNLEIDRFNSRMKIKVLSNYQITRMFDGRTWKQMNSNKNKKQSWKLDAFTICSKLLKYFRDAKL
jgi:hypothetical protein